MPRQVGVPTCRRAVAPLLWMLLAAPALARAQALDSLVVRLGAMSAVTGMEDAMADTLRALLPGAAADRAGNVVLARGTGVPVRVAMCPMDEIGYVVGDVTDDGYLTLRRVGGTPVGPLYDQWLEGQRVTVYGVRGPVNGVVGVRSTHLTRGRTSTDEPFNLDNAYVDVGARNRAEALGLGIAVLSPMTRAKEAHRYGEHGALLAAPWMGERAACAALLSASRRAGTPANGTTVVAFVRRQHFGKDGAGFLLRGYAGAQVLEVGGNAANDSILVGTTWQHVTEWALTTRYPLTPVETVALSDVTALEARLVEWLR